MSERVSKKLKNFSHECKNQCRFSIVSSREINRPNFLRPMVQLQGLN
nr:MAG TPA: hypothetical protein [Caudoviricetes sp.]